jgi:hypothetical protein
MSQHRNGRPQYVRCPRVYGQHVRVAPERPITLLHRVNARIMNNCIQPQSRCLIRDPPRIPSAAQAADHHARGTRLEIGYRLGPFGRPSMQHHMMGAI